MTSLLYCRHPHPGAPIEIIKTGEGSYNYVTFISDAEAIRLVADLSKAILANTQAKTRPELDCEVRPD